MDMLSLGIIGIVSGPLLAYAVMELSYKMFWMRRWGVFYSVPVELVMLMVYGKLSNVLVSSCMPAHDRTLSQSLAHACFSLGGIAYTGVFIWRFFKWISWDTFQDRIRCEGME